MSSIYHRHLMFSVSTSFLCIALTLFAMGCSDSVECKANTDCGAGMMCINENCVRPVAGGTDSASGANVDSLDTAYISEPDSTTATDTDTVTDSSTDSSVDTASSIVIDTDSILPDTTTDTDSSTGDTDDTATETSTATDTGSDTDSDVDGCYVGNFFISNAEDLAEFEGYRCIVGSLSILGTPFSTLSLPRLEAVTGDLVINNNQSLVEISLPLLTRLGIRYTTDPTDRSYNNELPVGLYIAGNPLLQNLETFNSVTKIEGSVTIERNASLVSLAGLENIVTLPRLTITSNDALQTLDGLNNLRIIERNVAAEGTVPDGLYIAGNPVLESLQALSSLESVEGAVHIAFNAALQTLHGLEKNTIFQKLRIEENASLTTLEGLEQIVTIGNNLEILGNPNLVSLKGLTSLGKITQHLIITGNGSLLSADGLTNPFTVEGGVGLESNNALTDLQVLSGMQTQQSIRIQANESLTSVAGLENITQLNKLTIKDNPVLTDLSGLGNLERITPAAGTEADGGFVIESNAALQSLAGFHSLTHLEKAVISENGSLGELFVSSNELNAISITISNNALMTLSGLEGATDKVTELIIRNSTALISLQGLDNLTDVNTLVIDTNVSLGSLAGLNALENVGDLTFKDCAEISDLQPLSNLKTVGSLTFSGMGGLTTLNGLQGLTEIPTLLVLFNNDALTDLTGLDNVRSIHELSVTENAALPNFVGLYALETIHKFTLQNNSRLANMEGLENVSVITGSFYVEGNHSLTDFLGFTNLVVVGATADEEVFLIQHNDALESLNGLDKVHTVSGQFQLRSNANLVDIVALGSLLYVGQVSANQNIVINANPSLPVCQLCQINWGAISPSPLDISSFKGNLTDDCGPTDLLLRDLKCEVD